MYYAGIGSRETPLDVLELMYHIGYQLALDGWTLRSGAADGADTAFERGCDTVGGEKQIFLPWPGFNHRSTERGRVFAGVGEHALALAAEFHPAWERCSRGARALHARNGYQVLGLHLDAPVDRVICWTAGAHGGGGTGQAIRIARSRNIVIHDLADPTVRTLYE